MDQPPQYDCQVGDRVLVRSVSYIGPEKPPHEAVVVDCRDQWIKVRYISDGQIDLVHSKRVSLDAGKR